MRKANFTIKSADKGPLVVWENPPGLYFDMDIDTAERLAAGFMELFVTLKLRRKNARVEFFEFEY